MLKRKRRALILAGAGASVDFGAPSTAALTKNIKKRVLDDAWMKDCGGDRAYQEIHDFLTRYLLGGACEVNFEHVYHCAHELLFTFQPDPGAANEYRPLLVPFIERRFTADERALQALATRIEEFIFAKLATVCDKPEHSLESLTTFVSRLRMDHVTRIYTTNYDDLLLQAAPDLYTGFEPALSPEPKRFDAERFWRASDDDCVFHLHGSVHLGFPVPSSRDTDLGTLCWFDDRAEASKHSSYGGSGERRMDGSEVNRTALITGLDKLSRLQNPPFSHYYASMARDALTADIIYVIGSGLGDLHINTWLRDARRRKPKPSLVFVDYWRNGFLHDTRFESDRNPKSIEMLHTLLMCVNADYKGYEYGSGWTLAKDRTCAVWDKGFLAFLDASDELGHVLGELA